MSAICNQKILLGVTGGIAAYKSCELVRLLKKAGHEVKVIMTEAAKAFIQPNTFAALSQNSVYDSLFDFKESPMLHIELAKWADKILVAPASAATISALAQGQADTLLSCVCLATQASCYLAPAMNRQMWEHPATRQNVEKLQTYGYRILFPEAGEQACGDVGFGRMLEPEVLVESICGGAHTFADLNILISAGPTVEKIDPVRYFSNFSSGKMGYALAKAFAEQGAKVHLISGPTHVLVPAKCQVTRITSAQDMLTAVMHSLEGVDIFISAAAIADYMVAMQPQKIKKQAEKLTLSLTRTSDVLSAVTNKYPDCFTVGFCAETQATLAAAKAKLQQKKCQVMIANQVHPDGYPFGEDTNAVTYITPEQTVDLPKSDKQQLARQLANLIFATFAAQRRQVVNSGE